MLIVYKSIIKTYRIGEVNVSLFSKVRSKIFWREHSKYNFGGKDTYLIIRRRGKIGLFSYYITIVGEIKRALNNNMIPVIDWMNYPNTFMDNSNIGVFNPYEEFFLQPCGIGVNEALKNGKKIVFSGEKILQDRPMDTMECLEKLKDKDNEWRKICKQYMQLSTRAEQHIKKYADKIFTNEHCRFLGVLCRGTDYIALKPSGHPVQPEPDEMMNKVHEVMQKQECDKILLVTEDSKIEDMFLKRFGDIVVVPSESHLKYDGHSYLSDLTVEDSQEKKINNGLDYLMRIMLLAKCNCFVAGRTSGCIGVMLQEHNFDYVYFFDKGRYK